MHILQFQQEGKIVLGHKSYLPFFCFVYKAKIQYLEVFKEFLQKSLNWELGKVILDTVSRGSGLNTCYSSFWLQNEQVYANVLYLHKLYKLEHSDLLVCQIWILF